MSSGRTISQGNSYPSISWADTLDIQRSALRWDVKRAMKSLCDKLAEIGEECFVVTVNISNGWVGHLGTRRGDEYVDEKSHILYDFLNYCAESFHAEQNYEVTENGSDTDSCVSDGHTNSDGEDEIPITISRPGDENKRFLPIITPNEGQRMSAEAPTNLPAGKMVPVEPSGEKFIVLTPADIQTATQKVLETEYQTTTQRVLETGNQTVVLHESSDAGLKTLEEKETLIKDKMVGGKRKRKQSFESMDKLRSTAQPTNDAQSLKEVKGRTNQKNKRKRENPSTKPGQEGSSNKLQHTSKKVDTEDPVVESTRVLRARHLQKKKDSSEGEEEEEDGVVDSSDFDVDDAKDEDWDMDFEERGLYGKPDRDNLGRYKSRRSSGRKQKRMKESSEVIDKHIDDESLEVAKDGIDNNESDKLVRVKFIHRIKEDEKGIEVMEGRLETLEENQYQDKTGSNEGGKKKDSEQNQQIPEPQSTLKSGSSSKRKKSKSITADARPYTEEAKPGVKAESDN